MRDFRAVVAMVGLLCSLAMYRDSLQAQDFRVGAAKRDITPTEPIRLSGYAGRNKPSEGVAYPIFARALAIEDPAGAKHVLVTLELIAVSRQFTESIADRLKARWGIERSRFLIIASHTHAGPSVYGNLNDMLDFTPQELEAIRKHTEAAGNAVFDAASEALSRMEPARLAFGHGKATFDFNRRIFTPHGVDFGANPDGPVDHDVPVLRIETPDGRLRAVVFGYACHGTTLGSDYNLIGGDWPGYTQKALEEAYPGIVALFTMGAGADIDPQPREQAAAVPLHGLEMAGAIAAVLSREMKKVNGPIRSAFERVTLRQAAMPSREEFEKRLKDEDVYVQAHARRNLEKLKRGEPLTSSYDSPVQVWSFGSDLTLVALGGEVVVDYVLRLKRELGAEKLWVAAYANDVFAYIPSVRILIEGGYEADYSMLYYDFPTRWATDVEETLIKAVHDLVGKTVN